MTGSGSGDVASPVPITEMRVRDRVSTPIAKE